MCVSHVWGVSSVCNNNTSALLTYGRLPCFPLHCPFQALLASNVIVLSGHILPQLVACCSRSVREHPLASMAFFNRVRKRGFVVYTAFHPMAQPLPACSQPSCQRNSPCWEHWSSHFSQRQSHYNSTRRLERVTTGWPVLIRLFSPILMRVICWTNHLSFIIFNSIGLNIRYMC